MSRCEATTKKGTRCRNEALEGSRYCRVHAEQAERSGSDGPGEETSGEDLYDLMEDLGEVTRTVLGVAAVGGALILAWKLGRRC